MTNLQFGEPRAAYLLLLLPVMSLLWFRSKVYMTRRARYTLLGLRMGCVALLVLALADLRLPKKRRGTGRAVALALDVSDSVGRETAEDLATQITELWPQWRAAAGPGAGLQLAVVADKVVALPAEATAGARLDLDVLQTALEKVRDGDGKRGTNLAAALAWSRDAFPAAGAVRLVMLSDGNATRGELDAELLATRLRSVQIHSLEVGPEQDDPLHVVSFRAPTRVFVGDEYTVAGRVSSKTAGSVRLTLRQNDTIVHRQTLAVTIGETPWSHKLRAGSTGAVSLELSIDPIDIPDLHPENNAFSAFTRVRQVPKVLVATGTSTPDLALVKALKKANLDFQVTAFADLSESDALLARHSAIVVDSPASQDLTEAQQDALVRYVENKGGGLAFVGGRNTLTRGTWLRERLSEALPVELVPRTQSSPFGLYILLDSSSSMTGPPIAQVRFAAKRIISMMRGRHLGVANFNTDVTPAVPFQLIEGKVYESYTKIDDIRALGGTSFFPGLRLAHAELMRNGTSDNHILLLSDGQPNDQFVVKRFFETLRRDGIRVSTVGIGTQVNSGLLQEIAQACDGKYYGVDDLTKLVQIFEEEIERLIGPPYEEVSFVPTIDRSHFLSKNLPKTGVPKLHGYLGTRLKAGAEAPIVNGYGDPILAFKQIGLGKSVAWASDIHGPWGKDWRRWSKGFVPFWEGVLKAVVRSEVSDFKLGLSLASKAGRVVVDAVDKDGNFLNGETLEVVVRPPGGDPVERLRLRQTEEGRYEGSFAANRRGFYPAELFRRVGGEDKRVNQGGVALGYDPEYHPGNSGRTTLERMASATGGRVLSDLVDVTLLMAEEVEHQRQEVLRFWPGFAAFALVLFFLEIALRRLGKFHVDKLDQLEGGAEEGAKAYQVIGERYLQMAEEFDQAGNSDQAQKHYLKARSFFLKSNSEEKASRMWEKYRQLERR